MVIALEGTYLNFWGGCPKATFASATNLFLTFYMKVRACSDVTGRQSYKERESKNLYLILILKRGSVLNYSKFTIPGIS